MHDNKVGTGEYIFWLIMALLVGLALGGLLIQTALKLVLGISVTLLQGIEIELALGLLTWLMTRAPRGKR